MKGVNYEPIPLEMRLTVKGFSDFCKTCRRFTRRGGGCPGMAAREQPVCHTDFGRDAQFPLPVPAYRTGRPEASSPKP